MALRGSFLAITIRKRMSELTEPERRRRVNDLLDKNKTIKYDGHELSKQEVFDELVSVS